MDGGQTKAQVSGWTVDTLSTYVQSIINERDQRYEQRFEAQQIALKDALQAAKEAVQAALTGADKAVAKAEMASEKRFESVNEFRQTLSDQTATFLPRQEYDRAHTDLVQRVDELRDSLTKAIGAVQESQIRREGKGSGMNQLVGWIFGGVGLLVGLITIFVWLSSMQPKVERNSAAIQQQAPSTQAR